MAHCVNLVHNVRAEQGMQIGSASSIAAEVRAGSLDPVDVVEAALRRIDEANPRIGAFARVRHDAARREARALLDRPDLARLPLAGVPVAVKDNVPMAGEPMRQGSAATSEQPQPCDDLVVNRLRAAGAVVVGATAMCEGALWAVTDGAGWVTRNPRDLSSAGGSSGGSAAAVAAGLVPLAHGTDAMGSIRIPAATCGVVGYKAGRDWVRAATHDASDWHGISVDGVVAGTVEDAWLAMTVLSGHGDIPPISPPGPLRVRLEAFDRSAGVRYRRAAAHVGSALRGAGVQVHPLSRATGWQLRRTQLGAVLGWPRAARAACDEAAHPERLQRRTVQLARLEPWAAPLRHLAQVDESQRLRMLAQVFAHADVIVGATLSDRRLPGVNLSGAGAARNARVSVEYTEGRCVPWNVLGCPAVTIPVTVDDGPPVGVQLAARPGHDTLLAWTAATLCAALGAGRPARQTAG